MVKPNIQTMDGVRWRGKVCNVSPHPADTPLADSNHTWWGWRGPGPGPMGPWAQSTKWKWNLTWAHTLPSYLDQSQCGPNLNAPDSCLYQYPSNISYYYMNELTSHNSWSSMLLMFSLRRPKTRHTIYQLIALFVVSPNLHDTRQNNSFGKYEYILFFFAKFSPNFPFSFHSSLDACFCQVLWYFFDKG